MTITRTTDDTLIAKLIKQGPLPYIHTYCQTMTSAERADHILNVPNQLITLAAKQPTAKVIEYGDATLGIEIDDKVWAAEQPDPAMRPAKTLSHEVWQYLNLALGREIDGMRFGDTWAK